MNQASVEVGATTFHVRGRTVEVLFGGEWLMVWKITVVENHGDLALDVDLNSGTVKVTNRNTERPPEVSRLITDNDFVLYDLENGKTLTIELTRTANDMLKTLVENGAPFEGGTNVRRKTPYWEEG